MRKKITTMIAISLSFAFLPIVNEVSAKEVESIKDPYTINTNTKSYVTKQYKHPEAARKQALIDYEPAITYIIRKIKCRENRFL